MSDITNATIAILATDGYEKSELFEPKRHLEAAGANVHVVSLQDGSIKSWDEKDWGESVAVDKVLDNAKIEDYDALVLPGGQINPDVLRTQEAAVKFVRDFVESGKPVAAICHAPWMLIEAGVIKGRKVTSYHSISTDVKNAGGEWEDAPVIVDNGLITSRQPGDLDAFCTKIVEEVARGRRERPAA